ncbi:MAG: hypothetical protein JRI39_14250 [Deltaproteobacteria bacterium]|nr:hypothetical protein [Deltaproteobacteria bacterium]
MEHREEEGRMAVSLVGMGRDYFGRGLLDLRLDSFFLVCKISAPYLYPFVDQLHYCRECLVFFPDWQIANNP